MLDMWLIVNVDNLAEIPPKIGDVVEVDVPQVLKHWPAGKGAM